jgi:RHS repeat-associated protein
VTRAAVRSGACITKRYYTMAGTTVAMRDSAAGALTYLLGDQLGSTSVSVNAAGGTPVVQRYLPYGMPRSTTGGSAVTEKGWIGQTRDTSTGLQYLNARYYDPAIGRFTATDPLANLGEPGSIDAYGYGLGNPVTHSDQSGLYVELENRGSVALGRQYRLAAAGLARKPVTGRYHGSWPSRRGYRPLEPREPAFPILDTDADRPPRSSEGSVRLDGYNYPDPVEPPAEAPVVDGHDDLVNVGTCGSFSLFAGVGGSFSGCSITIDGERGFSFTPGAGAGSPSIAVGGGDVFSNSRSLEEFTGGAWCGSAGYAAGVGPGGSGTGCSSVGSDVYTFYAGLGFEARPGASGSLYYAETEVVSTESVAEDVTSWVRDLESGVDQLLNMLGGGGLR